MLIEMWTDYACPFCYIGKRRLEEALKQVEHKAEVVYRCFELDPTAERDISDSIYEKLAKKYGMSLEQAKLNCKNMEEMAKESGLDYNFDTMKLTNTFDAHRLTMYAKTQGFMNEMSERILHAFFTESKHIGDHTTLTDLAVEVGLNREKVTKLLDSDEMTDAVRSDEQEAQELGIQGVPFFLINRKYAISGAQPTETFISAINQINEQDGPFIRMNDDNGATCTDESCEV
ncbi:MULTISPECIES: DsbA family oxidoreductase [Bacillaceae]|uniref:DsbA family oxidoreductase n=1 Tax=Bacillaceae TaxID=186817 RepID=UPI000BFD0DE9|nr:MULTISPECIES: DsbA family oxidoreductase [Bacillaceae]PGT84393.1 disulfide bond formation protein DsbA [Bacillus sp. AFS040349]UGB33024.1 DsbA family oxidoreductase [Metabacillus sp. B2-18]